MIRITLLLSFTVIMMAACSTHKNISEKSRISNCAQNYKNGFSRIAFEETPLIVNTKTEKITEVKFICLYSFLQIKKIMYDNFGKWDDESMGKQSQHPLLIWKDLPLLKNTTEKFTVIADGEEPYNKETYGSISVLDQNGMDVLSAESQYRNPLLNLFSNMIKETDHQNEEFHRLYLKKVSPK